MIKSCRNRVRIVLLLIGWILSAEIASAQPSPEEVIRAVVGLRSTIPMDARTAPTLGTERVGSGVVIDEEGLVLTIGYLILEASAVTISTRDSPNVEAKIVAYDHAT